MALKKDFYSEIFDNEHKWIELINSKLLNSIYCDLALKPFYIEKRNELFEEYNLTHNNILGQIISIIDAIINRIEMFSEQYKGFQTPDISSLVPLFLITRMNNVSQNHIETSEYYKDDYLYDDFPEERMVK